MIRQRSLFHDIELAEEQIEKILQPLYSPLWHMIHDSFDDFHRRRTVALDEAFLIMTEGDAAQFLRPQIVHRAKKLFAGTNVKVERYRNQFFLNVGGELAVTPKKFKFKKYDEGLTFSSYPTRQNGRYWRQEPIDGFPRLPRIIVGYQFVELMTDIKIWVAHPYGRLLRTCYLLPDQSGTVIAKFVPPEAIEPEEDRGFKVNPKRLKEENG